MAHNKARFLPLYLESYKDHYRSDEWSAHQLFLYCVFYIFIVIKLCY
jgi:hypothetical protein